MADTQFDYEKYEQECEQIREQNEVLLADFRQWLVDARLSSKTVERHVDNVDFYINEFLLREDAETAADGVDRVSSFLGYWFIRKAMWASKTSIKGNAASFKKFYRFMLQRGEVDKEGYDLLLETIRDEMDDWLETLARYDNPDIEDWW